MRLLCVLAHPDDESLGTGGTLARYAAEGIETYLVTATRGERGRFGNNGERPAPAVVGAAREAELRAAAAVLGVHELEILGYPDGALASVDPIEAQEAIGAHLRRIKPHVVVTFGPDGGYGHPDHIAISQLTTAAVMRTANGHAVSKLYHLAWSDTTWQRYQSALKRLSSTVDGVVRFANAHPDWEITTRIDAAGVWETVWRAVQCHRTQISMYGQLEALRPDQHRALWGAQEFYRVFSLVNGGPAPESDLFDGLR